jgi:uncharacterized protein YerC
MARNTGSQPEELGPQQLVRILFTALTRLPASQLISLYGDLFTAREAVMFAKRLAIARYLLHGYSYQQIQRLLSVTPATISQIQKVLSSSGEGLRDADTFLTLNLPTRTSVGDSQRATLRDTVSVSGLANKKRTWWKI